MGVEDLLASLWHDVGGPEAARQVVLGGTERTLPSVFPVAAVATAQIAAATLAVREVMGARHRTSPPAVEVSVGHAIAAFRSERYLQAKGWQLPAIDDPLIGDYPAADGWIRLHTNYTYHRDAVLAVLGVPCEREAVARAVAAWKKDDLEQAVVDRGGAAAAMRTSSEWAAHAQGRAVAAESIVATETVPATQLSLPTCSPDQLPLAGVRVLDLTRVIAGPVCTRFLSGYGADVLRIDPPGFLEVPALLGDTTLGKRRASLDLRKSGDRRAFDRLVASAHVLISGYRSSALTALGYGPAALRALNSQLILGSLNAYGFTGPWRERRGFDSLVQMSSGIAARGQELAKAAEPKPLPAQALDHGAGYLLAAGTCLALARSLRAEGASHVRVSLARTAKWLIDQGETGTPNAPDYTMSDAAPFVEEAASAWGAMGRVTCPGQIGDIRPQWRIDAGPLGVDAAAWT